MKRNSYFWTSYSDLMTSLFFIMLVLFVLTVVMLQKNHAEAEAIYNATKKQMEKIQEIEEGIKRIDQNYFGYNEQYKKHILKIDVNFPMGKSDIRLLGVETRKKLADAGRVIARFMQDEHKKNPNVKYLLVIEGQASGGRWFHYNTDEYRNNDVLSYQRALGLWHFWQQCGIRFGEECEPLICGSGEGGVPRETVDERKNQRFLVHIILKPGTFDSLSTSPDNAPDNPIRIKRK